MTVSALGYVGIEATDVDRWLSFAVDILGLRLGDKRGDGEIALRMDDRAARLLVRAGDRDGLGYLGWEVPGEQALLALHQRLEAAGVQARFADEEDCRTRAVQRLFRCLGPDDVPHEFFCGQLRINEPFQPSLPISGFRTGDLGMGHVVLQVDDLPDALRFYTDLLGFRLSDQLGKSLYFLRCNARHHSIGLASIGGAPRLLHIMVEVGTLDDVGYALDRCLDNGIVASTIGLHANDRMTSFYARSPSGFDVEYGWNGLVVDEATWTPTTIDRPTIWGHRQLDAAHLPKPRPFQRSSLARADR
jgi:extradiol dioxygenase